MVPENIDPLLWYVCKFCRRAYQLRDDLVKHKRSNHLELFLQDLAAKRRAREGAIPTESTTHVRIPKIELPVQGSSKLPVASYDESVASEESSNASVEISRSANKLQEFPPLITNLHDSIIESIPSAHDNLANSIEILNSAPSSPTGPPKSNEDSNQSRKEPNESENKPENKTSRYCTSTPNPAGPPKSPKNSEDDTNSLDEFITSSQTGPKLLKCDQCDRTFKQEHYRKLHITFAHDKNKRYPCQFCPQIFTHPRSRVGHVAKEHVDRMFQLTLAKSAEEKSGDWASQTPKRGKKKLRTRVYDLQKRSRPNPRNNGYDLLIESHQSDGSTSNLYECDDCDGAFGSMSEWCLHKSYHKRKSNVH